MSDDDDIIYVKTKPNTSTNTTTKTKPKSKKLVKDGWVKKGSTAQEKISLDPIEVEKYLQGFEKVYKDDYADIQIGTYVRYISKNIVTKEEKMRFGGIVIKNCSPSYLVLKVPKSNLTWCVSLSPASKKHPNENIIYRRLAMIRNKDERARYADEVFCSLESGRTILLDVESLKKLSGADVPNVCLPQTKSVTKTSTTQKRIQTLLLDDDDD